MYIELQQDARGDDFKMDKAAAGKHMFENMGKRVYVATEIYWLAGLLQERP